MSCIVRFETHGAAAELELWDDGSTATLASLNATFKRRGTGTKALVLALNYADLVGLTVVLQVSPYGEDMGMDKTALKAYYMTHGFVWQGDCIMQRTPKEASVG